MKNLFNVRGNLVDVHQKKIYKAEILVEGERILDIRELDDQEQVPDQYMMPGFIDAHVHIESSMLIPSEFARLAVVHGTVATVSDPHEIANVCGLKGIDYMIEDGKKVPFKFNFGAPGCVPATPFETSGAAINAQEIEQLLRQKDILYLSEMMNFPGVLHNDEEVMKKIAAAQKHHKPVDGHAPGLRGAEAKKYIDAGISTDHECFTKEEALDKLQHGMKIIIREGSAARNFEALADLLHNHAENMMLCSDDKHPDSLVKSHINELCTRALAKGIDIFNVLQAACVNPVNHYKLRVGLLRKNDFADFIVVNNLTDLKVLQTYINGKIVAENGISRIRRKKSIFAGINNFDCERKKPADFEIDWNGEKQIPVIEALDGQLITNKIQAVPKVAHGKIVSDIDKDVLKIVVVNRYNNAPVATGFIKNFNLKKGAIASSVAHDSHNIVAVGTDDNSLCEAVNLIIKEKGGVSFVSDLSNSDTSLILPLPVGGLMSKQNGYEVAQAYSAIDRAAKESGSTLGAPFMTLSFMALLVIPHLKLSDKGLFDGGQFKLIAQPGQ